MTQQRLKKFAILIVDDDRLMLRLISDVLTRLGFGHVYKASSGAQALAMVDTTPVDFIICDWRMADMNGIEFTRKVRDAASIYTLVPIIMLTGNAEEEHVRLARDAGVTEYLIKPFTVRELCRRIEEIIERPREFVLAPTYKGPSRRRHSAPPPDGVERRAANLNASRTPHARRSY